MNLEIFKNNNFGAVRVIKDEKDEPWFVLSDVCKILELSNPTKVAKLVDEDDLTTIQVIDNLGRKQKANAVNESGLYQVIFQSRKPQAKQFKRWVTSEVLPSIRKHGVYAKDELLANPDLFIEALQNLKKEREEKAKLKQQVEVMKPKVIFADSVSSSYTSILVGQFAKIISTDKFKIGQKRLFNWLRENKYLMKDNMPYQKFIENGIFEIKEGTINNPDGSIRITKTTKITGKGQVYLTKKIYEYFGVA